MQWDCRKGSIVEFSEKPIASIPFRKINWQNAREVQLHDAITENVKIYIKTCIDTHLEKIHTLFHQLFEILK